MLITNYASMCNVLGRQHSGQTGYCWTGKPETIMNFYTQDDRTNLAQIERSSWPQGTEPPSSYVLAPKGAMLSSTTTVGGLGSLSAAVAMGRSVSSTINGTSSLTVNAGLVVQMACTILAQATTSAALKGAISMAANLAGSGSLTASLKLLANVVSSITGSASVTSALRGTARIAAAINVNESVATTEQIAAQVWNTVAASFNTAGTMGRKLNDAAAGGGGGGSGETIIRADETAQGGDFYSIRLNSAASTTDHIYIGTKVLIVSGTGAEQMRPIKFYYGTNRRAEVEYAWHVAPDNTSVYRILA